MESLDSTFLQDLLLKAYRNLTSFIWTHEILPLDILLLALIDRDDDPHALRIVVNILLMLHDFIVGLKSIFLIISFISSLYL